MGRPNPTFRDLVRKVEERWQTYRRTLRRRDQPRFDRLFDYIREHADAGGILNHEDRLAPMLVSIDLEQERRLDNLDERVDALDDGGWLVLQGIADSIWVAPAEGVSDTDRRPLAEIAAEVSARANIELEYEAAFDWVAFCPLWGYNAGSLTKYFGKRRGEDLSSNPADGLGEAVKIRGIECRQHDTPPYVARVQRELIATFDRTRDPEVALDVLANRLEKLAVGQVEISLLTVQQQVSKRVKDHTQETLTVCALQRAKHQGTPLSPGQRVESVVVDADARGIERVRLAHERFERYDPDWYREQRLRAAAGILSPTGYTESKIENRLGTSTTPSLQSYN